MQALTVRHRPFKHFSVDLFNPLFYKMSENTKQREVAKAQGQNQNLRNVEGHEPMSPLLRKF